MTRNHDELKVLIGRMELSQPAPSGCPGDEVLASYLEGGLSEADHADFERHLADCSWCLERVGILGRTSSHEGTEDVPELVLARALRLAGPQSDSRPAWLRSAPRWAAAAAVLLALSLVIRGQLPDAPVADPDGSRVERNLQPLMPAPTLISPAEGSSVDLANDSFDWNPVPDSLYYRVRIVSDAGDLLWQERVQQTRWKPPAGLRLEPGAEYFVRVDAYLARDKSISSDYIAFSVSERR